MAGPEFDIKAFGEHVARELPSYARPLFVRLLPAMETTGTFKLLRQLRRGDPSAAS